ncbi:MAG: hypothetical protein IMF02_06540 [Proteobacteria bacterium]|nr:hypothetical protein [Pseudomonadota bacterium]
MNLLRVLIALAVLILGSLVLQFAVAPFSIGNGSFQIGQSIGRVAGGIIWGAIIWGIIKLFRGDERSPDMSSFIFYTAAIYIVLLAVSDFFSA